MTNTIILASALIIGLTIFNATATFLVMKSDATEKTKKVMQFLLIWLLPVAGPIVAMMLHRNELHLG